MISLENTVWRIHQDSVLRLEGLSQTNLVAAPAAPTFVCKNPCRQCRQHRQRRQRRQRRAMTVCRGRPRYYLYDETTDAPTTNLDGPVTEQSPPPLSLFRFRPFSPSKRRCCSCHYLSFGGEGGMIPLPSPLPQTETNNTNFQRLSSLFLHLFLHTIVNTKSGEWLRVADAPHRVVCPRTGC